jgi:2-methylisocitrate lyase-like PEP mutase family enzyme
MLFINARTDLFLKAKAGQEALVDEALARQRAYSAAGADGFFVPGLTDPALIADICRRATCPINVMMSDALTSVAMVAPLGVARASFGPRPYIETQADLLARSRAALES